MKLKLVVLLTVNTALLPLCLDAEEGASGHYAPGVTADFMDTLTRKAGLAAVNFFTYYNGGAGVDRAFEFGGRTAFGV
jgi:hypothetical protein